MSAAFKNAKKKLSQTELRKYMNEHKKSLKEVKKIDSPLAKYNEKGQLTCILCHSIVRSEAVWTIHINAKQHKQNVEAAKKLKEKTNNFTTPVKRSSTPPPDAPEKKLKSILKNSNKKPNDDETEKNSSELAGDFFDSKNTPKPVKPTVPTQKAETSKPEEPAVSEDQDPLPEGFFDDPKLDAKARHQDYKDPVEEEWERFMKEIKNADTESAAIIAEDQEEATTERQIDEIDEQMKKLSRVLDLEKKKEEVIASTSESKNSVNVDEDDVDVEDSEFDEFLDWRAKKSFK